MRQNNLRHIFYLVDVEGVLTLASHKVAPALLGDADAAGCH